MYHSEATSKTPDTGDTNQTGALLFAFVISSFALGCVIRKKRHLVKN